jgi:hypothetical protein
MVYADDVNILWNVRTVKKNKNTSVVASKEIGLEVNVDKTKYMVMSGDQNAGRSHRMKIDNSYFMLPPPSDTAHTNAHKHNSHYTSALLPSQTIQSLYTNKEPHITTEHCSSHMQHQTCIHNKQQTVC